MTVNFKRRKGEHIRKIKSLSPAKDFNIKVYEMIRLNGGLDKFNFKVLEEIDCSKEEASLREFHFYTLHNANMNENVPSRTEVEYEKFRKGTRRVEKQKYYQRMKLAKSILT